MSCIWRERLVVRLIIYWYRPQAIQSQCGIVTFNTDFCIMTKKHRHQRKHNEENHHHHKKHHHHHQKHKKKTIDNPILKVLLEGVYDTDCVLSKLRGCPHLLKDIWRDVRRSCLSQISLPNKKVNRMGVKNDGELEDGGIIQSKYLNLKRYEGSDRRTLIYSLVRLRFLNLISFDTNSWKIWRLFSTTKKFQLKSTCDNFETDKV